jgi:dolichol-phosphate mannosyltransferase
MQNFEPISVNSLTFVVPCLNESDNIPLIISRINAIKKRDPLTDYDLMLVDDGSTDDTLAVMRQAHGEYPFVHYVSLSRNFGSHAAIEAGLSQVQTDAAVILSADLQDDPDLVMEMLAHARNGAEVVIGTRSSRKDSWLARQGAKLFYWLFNRIGAVKLPEGGVDFVLLTRRTIEFIRSHGEPNVNIFILMLWPGFRSKRIYYHRSARTRGKSKWTFSKRLRLALDSFFGFSAAPLQLITFLGLIMSGGAFAYGVFVFLKTLVFGSPVEGWPTLAAVIAFGFGITFLALGIMAEYILRILDFVRNRPRYVTVETDSDSAVNISSQESKRYPVMEARKPSDD